jgi:hypothetical protein
VKVIAERVKPPGSIRPAPARGAQTPGAGVALSGPIRLAGNPCGNRTSERTGSPSLCSKRLARQKAVPREFVRHCRRAANVSLELEAKTSFRTIVEGLSVMADEIERSGTLKG